MYIHPALYTCFTITKLSVLLNRQACPIVIHISRSCNQLLININLVNDLLLSDVKVGLTPEYQVLFGRRDGTNASRELADKFLPGPQFTYEQLKQNFSAVGLNETDLVALSGAHTIGRVRCQLVRLFGVNIPDTNAEFRANLSKACPNASVDFSVLQNLDLKTPDKFDNNYYKNLRRGEGIIPSDQTLQNTDGPINRALVKDFAQNQENFFKQFPISTIKMGNIGVITDRSKGQIRVNCRFVNPPSLIEQVLVASE